MLKFFRKLLLFALIPLPILVVYVWLTPPNLYTHRAWEALRPFWVDVGGPFYPDQRLEMVEFGDLAIRTDYAVPKPVTFITDAYGQRYDGPPAERYDILIVGDSTVAGFSLTQTETIAAVLAQQTGLTVYPVYLSLAELLKIPHLIQHRPKMIILARIERDLGLEICPTALPEHWPEVTGIPAPVADVKTRIYADRLLREVNYLTKYLRAVTTEKNLIVNKTTRMVFFKDSLASPDLAVTPNVINMITRCDHWLKAQGVDFLFLPIPDKETIYFDAIPPESRPALDHPRDQFLRTVITGIQAEQTAVIDLLTAYQTSRREGITPYQLDDTHWNAVGVRLAAELITAKLDCPRLGCKNP